MAPAENLSSFIKLLSEGLDIPIQKYQEAETHYNAIGEWLGRKDSKVSTFFPIIYPQGSFNIGTAIRPIGDGDYDLDIVCCLNLDKKQIAQKSLKMLVGNELKSYSTAHNMSNPVEEGKRCWTLNYSDGSHFHVDVLPAIPDAENFKLLLESNNIYSAFTKDALAITDTTHPYYELFSENWLGSNPKGYAKWFKEKMAVEFTKKASLFVEDCSYAQIDDVPYYRIRTVLQRVVQILKRHRDIMFNTSSEKNNKPASVIITTLAAMAYKNEEDVLTALVNIVKTLDAHIQIKDGKFNIQNPSYPIENFADRWNSDPTKKEAFDKWLLSIREYINILPQKEGIDKIASFSESVFGKTVITDALSELGKKYSDDRKNGALKMSSATGILGNSGETTVKNHTFYGK